MTQLLFMMGIGAAVLWAVFTITWLIQLVTRNAAIVDSVWAASFPLLAFLYYILAEGDPLRKGIITSLVIVWGMRLAIYLFVRTMGHEEDKRYTALREQWGRKQNLLMLRFYYFQALLALVLSLPFALIMMNTNPEIQVIELAGIALWIVAASGEALADEQMKDFKSNPLNSGKVCNVGLWYYSRHPNYFFEWLVWMSYFFFALGSPGGIVTIICPAAILFFLLKVTGIPYTETQIIKSRGEAYLSYQKTTSPFIPLPKKVKPN